MEKTQAKAKSPSKLQQCLNKTKAKIQKSREEEKARKAEVKTAKGIGYNSGWNDYTKIGTRRGVRNAAKCAYGEGMDSHAKAERLEGKYNRKKR